MYDERLRDWPGREEQNSESVQFGIILKGVDQVVIHTHLQGDQLNMAV